MKVKDPILELTKRLNKLESYVEDLALIISKLEMNQ